MNPANRIFISAAACAAGAAYPWLRAVEAYGSPNPGLFGLRADLALLMWVGVGVFCAALTCRWAASRLKAGLRDKRARQSFGQASAGTNIFVDTKRFAAPEPDDRPPPGTDPFRTAHWLAGNAWFAFPLIVALASPEIRAYRLPLGMYVPLGICLAFLFAYVLIESADLVELRELASTSRARVADETSAVQLFFFVSALGFLALHAFFVEAALAAKATPMGLFIGTGIIWWLPGALALLPLVLIHGLAESRLPRASIDELKAPLAGLAVGAAGPGLAMFAGSGPGTGLFLLCAVIGTVSGAMVWGRLGWGLQIVSSSGRSRRDDDSWDRGHSNRSSDDSKRSTDNGDQGDDGGDGDGGGGDSGGGNN